MRVIEELLQTQMARSIAALDAQLLLSHVLGISRTQLLTWPLRVISQSQAEAFKALVLRRTHGEPLAYLVGTKEFWSLPLTVNASVLVPRPETECLVDAVLRRFPAEDPYPYQILDLGTGSGAIALALASERPHWQVYAVDRSGGALAVAKHNARALSLEGVCFIGSDWFSALMPVGPSNKGFDIIVSNPPYLEEADRHLQQDGLCYEPLEALVGGHDGLRDLEAILHQAPYFLKPGGSLVLEHASTQGLAVRLLMKKHGFTRETTLKDHAGLDRLSLGDYKRFL